MRFPSSFHRCLRKFQRKKKIFDPKSRLDYTLNFRCKQRMHINDFDLYTQTYIYMVFGHYETKATRIDFI